MKRPKGKELWIGATSNVVGQGAATNDFTVVDEEAYGALSVAYLEKIVDSIGQANSGTEASKSADWSGCIATFTAIPPLTFTASADGNSSISPSGTVIVEGGEDQEFTFTTDSGYHVSNVCIDSTQNLGQRSSYLFHHVVANHTIAITAAENPPNQELMDLTIDGNADFYGYIKSINNTLDDGSGNMAVSGNISMSCISPCFSWGALQWYLWGLQWVTDHWVWTPVNNTLPLNSPFIHFNDPTLQETNQSLDIGVIRTSQSPDELTLWISRHLIVKKDFSCGGVANIAQGALVLGSDWAANNPKWRMPQIYLAHSEGDDKPAIGIYPENPRRDTLQIWRNEHIGYANVECGDIFILKADYPTIDLKTVDDNSNSIPQLRVTLKFDGANGMLTTSTGDLVLAGYSNHVRPLYNNQYLLGDASFKWKEIWAVTAHFGDAVFANGWRLTESSDNFGVLLLRPDGSIAQSWA